MLLVTPTAVELSVWISDCSWGYLVSMSVWIRGTMSLAVIKIAASPASAAEDMTNLIIWVMVRIGPLYLGLGSSSERNMCAPARLHVLEILCYAESE